MRTSRPWRITGHYMGLAFQLKSDDVLDFTASPEQLGKPVLSDLKEGKVTLPLIYALETDGATGKRLVRTVLEEKGFDEAFGRKRSYRTRAQVGRARSHGARRRWISHVCAKACVHWNANSDYGRALRTVPDFILERDN